jgi:hypothetical protein
MPPSDANAAMAAVKSALRLMRALRNIRRRFAPADATVAARVAALLDAFGCGGGGGGGSLTGGGSLDEGVTYAREETLGEGRWLRLRKLFYDRGGGGMSYEFVQRTTAHDSEHQGGGGGVLEQEQLDQKKKNRFKRCSLFIFYFTIYWNDGLINLLCLTTVICFC